MADWTPPERQIITLGEQSLPPDSPVTFLNKTLKSHGYIFGLSRNQDGDQVWTIYQLVEKISED
jgi:hypothetical protein